MLSSYCIQGSRARALYKAGMRTPQAIAESPIPEIAKALFESSAWAAEGKIDLLLVIGYVLPGMAVWNESCRGLCYLDLHILA